TRQVFLTTPHSFALVNLKPLLPGHVLVCPLQPHRRLTDLSPAELSDLFTSVQRVQHMLARHYFLPCPSPPTTTTTTTTNPTPPGEAQPPLPTPTAGAFNIAIQDGAEAGQTVSHVHVHVIPRIRGATAKPASTPSDAVYDQMAAEEGNVGGALWDRRLGRGRAGGGGGDGDEGGGGDYGFGVGGGREVGGVKVDGEGRPMPGGSFPSIEDAARVERGMREMEEEAAVYKRVLEGMERDGL
ncbi:histidine triad-like protein, partial [Chaetomium tenue]